MPVALPWLILLLPLAAAVVIALFTLRRDKLSVTLSTGAVTLSFAGSVFLFFFTGDHATDVPERRVYWLDVGGFKVSVQLLVDRLSALMTLVVTGVAMLIHIYSRGYMAGDRSFARYFATLSLFTFSMLGIVLANNFVVLFIFWELVGVSSYLLIGFWFEKPTAADAAKKAFLCNRIGDVGFILGILILWGLATVKGAGGHFDALRFQSLQQFIETKDGFGEWATLAGVLIFCGCIGKSAQFPLHVWLPDAMEGPTPVSALIHAATMVAAGIYMLCRVIFVLSVPGSDALTVIAWIGGITALLAALMAVQQDDIKRILAYSTLSQLGYMVMAVGLTPLQVVEVDPAWAGPAPAMYHLVTHAFFKALLFLGAGSVIVALHHEQNIWKMGGLGPRMPWTFGTFLLGTLALCGVPPLSGFYSKDSILALAAATNPGFFAVAVFVAALTAFYMTRLFVVAFLGGAKGGAADHAHESPGVMTWPLRILAALSVVAGFLGLEGYLAHHFNAHAAAHIEPWWEAPFAPFNHSPLAAWFGLFAVMIGVSVAWSLYHGAERDPLPVKLGSLARAMRNRFGFDEAYEEIVAKTQDALASFADWFDRWIVAGLMVRGAHGTTELLGRALRLVQTGSLQTYAFLFAAGVVVVLICVLH
ncbi:MAG: NADH-quinone oxidoreductase subunit L [Verrucomicrobia bacterium]|nr:NADH-quinone oxidoreductase subunit L [Verrucomicrobiota bacterium]